MIKITGNYRCILLLRATVTVGCRKLKNEKLHEFFTPHQMVLGCPNGYHGVGMWNTGGIRKNAYRVLWENLKARGHLENQGQIGRVTVKWILKEIGWESVEWINLFQDKGMRQVFVNVLINL